MRLYIIERFYLKWARLPGTRIYKTCAKAHKALAHIRDAWLPDGVYPGPTRAVVYTPKKRKIEVKTVRGMPTQAPIKKGSRNGTSKSTKGTRGKKDGAGNRATKNRGRN